MVKVETAREMLDGRRGGAAGRRRGVRRRGRRLARRRRTAARRSRRPASGTPELALVENPDILATVAHRKAKRPELVIGFAAETENVIEHAKAKLARKGCDWIVANDVSPETGVMGGDRNTVHLVTARRRRSLAAAIEGRGCAARWSRASPRRWRSAADERGRGQDHAAAARRRICRCRPIRARGAAGPRSAGRGAGGRAGHDRARRSAP